MDTCVVCHLDFKRFFTIKTSKGVFCLKHIFEYFRIGQYEICFCIKSSPDHSEESVDFYNQLITLNKTRIPLLFLIDYEYYDKNEEIYSIMKFKIKSKDLHKFNDFLATT